MGAVVCFRIVKKEDFIKETPRIEIPLLNIVKKKQLQQSFTSRRLNEDRVKIYHDNKFYIVKSNYFKDWTIAKNGIPIEAIISLAVYDAIHRKTEEIVRYKEADPHSPWKHVGRWRIGAGV